jgi:hypothetical protein
MSPVRITVGDLWTYAVSDSGGTARQPLSNLGGRKNAGHVHGRLTITVADRIVPHLGYFGPDDVCLGEWLVELCGAVNALAHGQSEYLFDEGEQGQPAFKFERRGPEVVFSIVESDWRHHWKRIVGGPRKPLWRCPVPSAAARCQRRRTTAAPSCT